MNNNDGSESAKWSRDDAPCTEVLLRILVYWAAVAPYTERGSVLSFHPHESIRRQSQVAGEFRCQRESKLGLSVT